jgi:hypothetical protein
MKQLQSLATAAVLLVATGMAPNVDAQQQQYQQGGSGYYGHMMGPWMMGRNGMMGSGMMGWNGQPMCAMMGSDIEGRLAYLKAELKITQALEPLWTAYASEARENAKSMATRCTTMMGQSGTTALSLPDRLDRHEQLMAAQLDSLRATNKVLKPLYDALDDTQKKAADQLFWGPMGMM